MEIRGLRQDLAENTNARLERVEADMRKVKKKLRIR